MKKDLRNTDKTEIKGWLKEQGEPVFRIDQIEDWLWRRPVSYISEMSNLSKSLRDKLEQTFYLDRLETVHTLKSKDGTHKMAFGLDDGKHVEGVLIPSKERLTACISTQVGCKMGCKFCATGQMGFGRNLSAGEIYLQAWYLNDLAEKQFGK